MGIMSFQPSRIKVGEQPPLSLSIYLFDSTRMTDHEIFNNLPYESPLSLFILSI